MFRLQRYGNAFAAEITELAIKTTPMLCLLLRMQCSSGGVLDWLPISRTYVAILSLDINSQNVNGFFGNLIVEDNTP